MPYVARTKSAKKKLERASMLPLRLVKLACGHTTDAAPPLSNPARWWCCGGWRRAV
jgi:hypothetical protein